MINKKEKNSNKRAMTQLKAYFLIINMIIAIAAFSWLISGYYGETVKTVNGIKIINEGSSGFSVNGKIYSNINEATVAANPIALGSGTPLAAGQKGSVSAITSVAEKSYTFTAPINFNTASGSVVTGTQFIPSGTPGTYNVLNAQNQIVTTGTQTDLLAAGIPESAFTPSAGPATACKGPMCFTQKLFSGVIMKNLMSAGMIGGIGYLVGSFLGDNGGIAGFLAGFGGTMAYNVMANTNNAYGGLGKFVGKTFGKGGLGLGPGAFGIVTGIIIFLFIYEKKSTKLVEFNCLPFQPPIGGEDCEKCNEFEQCSEYSCRSLGQACQLLNAGTGKESCDWVNPHDVNSPKIEIINVLKGYKWTPDTAVRPPATGAVISQDNGDCVKAFTPLEFTISTGTPEKGETSQCKIDYNLTKGFDEMSYYIGGSNLFSYNHTETMSLPSPSSINALSPKIKNDGTYTLYVRCRDANGNFNQDAYSVRFCVEKGPDTTPPRIDALSIPSNSPISYNTTNLYLEVYVNEPAECKWSREDRDFAQMETNMSCDTNVWEINNNNVYTCRTTLTGIKDRQDNEFYFRCKDQPGSPESERTPNVQSYLYNVIGTQPLNIIEITPSNETIKDSTDTVAINLEVKTDNGYNDGEAFCYFTTTQTTDTSISDKTCIGEEDEFIQFAETGDINVHNQRQNLITDDYTYYIKCVDLGGNAAYDCTKFSVEVDGSAPIVIRAYKESGQLKIMTHEEADCTYSNKDCNFEIEDGIEMSSLDNEAHTAEWLITKNYYIRCNDKYNNQPNPNTCSVIIRPYKFIDKSDVIAL